MEEGHDITSVAMRQLPALLEGQLQLLAPF
jgi:hypothetical protein